MRQTSALFDSAKEKCVTVRQQCCTRIEDAVDRVRPLSPGEDRIRGVPREKRVSLAPAGIRLLVS
jgi:hypothetical protein